MSYFLGIEVNQTDEGIFISQKKYAKYVLKKLKMESCKPMLTSVEERLKLERESGGDLVNSTNFRRLVGSLSSSKLELVGYTDNDWAGEAETCKSTSSYVFHLRAGVFSWCSKKQQVVTLSTAKAEYIAATNCAT
ncbi:uncharacterized mitochondrial protein AtMg00810-like [Lathyrus oleraceus]|uniref:uncharacterized mitochondrial protein AtMg00810-like n=1 Tax=Pisum sativum TaxID=3888 RepID=UPI0021CF5BA6|nr:uncharacterized mitochondrial protein AtMg00810-like [Pisum sativum]